MPEFVPGEAKTAVAPVVIRPAGLSCEAEIFLGPDETTKVVTSGRIPFTSTGASQDVRLPVAMPAAEGTYHVYVDVSVEDLLIGAYQAVEDVVVIPGEPPLPPPGTGVPTEAEIEAVKATVRYRLDHLWFDPCAGIYPPGGNEAVLEAVKPIEDLQARVNAEIARIQAEEREAVAEWYAEEDRLDAIQAKFYAINYDFFVERINACSISTSGRLSWKCVAPDGRYGCPNPDGLWWRSEHPEATVYNYLTSDERALIEEWNAGWFADRHMRFWSRSLYNAARAAWQSAQDAGLEYQARWKSLVRLHDELRIDYWYCGVPLGY